MTGNEWTGIVDARYWIYLLLGIGGRSLWIYTADSRQHHSSCLAVQPIFVARGHLHLSIQVYDSVSTASGLWPLRHVLLCDCFGPRRSRSRVLAVCCVGDASSSHTINWRRGYQLQLEAVSAVSRHRLQLKSHQGRRLIFIGWDRLESACFLAAHDAGFLVFMTMKQIFSPSTRQGV